MGWMYLLLAAAFEIAFVASMKASRGFTVLGPSVVTVLAVAGGIGFLTLALKTMPVSVAYPVWVGIGTVGSVALGAAVFGEALSPLKIGCVALIALGVAGLKITSP